MSLLHPGRRAASVVPAGPCCWVATGIPADGPMCPKHSRALRDTATAQAKSGYGMPHPCTDCGELCIGDDAKHEHWSQRDDDRYKRLADL